MNTNMTKQEKIIESLHVRASIDVAEELRFRVDFLKNYLLNTGANGYVLGISGGVDSTLTGYMARIACDEAAQETGKEFRFFAVRLPYGKQLDEDVAQEAVKLIRPHNMITVNIKAAVDASVEQFQLATGAALSDFHKGNTKARERMKVQYDIAAHFGLLVLGTDQAPEAATGFFTKFGDGAADVAPITGLTKGQVRQILQQLGATEELYKKTPTADLEDNRPQLPDEEALGFSYDDLDKYLTNQAVSSEVRDKIERQYDATRHKRHLPVTPFDSWWK
ncbi:ammonia-dependent NAD(+) synthetase [Brevibacillus borstelensis]|uniref:ammonia-dependent NAD(+) synthetase n=1 Tax=Brevibacillus borstelensis TaxID=45462 RepID=UPI0030C5AA23